MGRSSLLAMCALVTAVGPAVAQDFAATTASAAGDATIKVAPDRATLRIAVVSEAKSSRDAVTANAEKAEQVLDALRAALGREAQIRTAGFSLDPQYDYEKGGGRQLRGYIARNQVEVITGQLDRVGEAIDAAAQTGANDVDSLVFGLQDDLGVRLRALDEATRRARQKLDAMAAALGLGVSRIVSVSEHGSQPPMPVARARVQAESFGAAAATPVEPGRVEVRARVLLVAELEP